MTAHDPNVCSYGQRLKKSCGHTFLHSYSASYRPGPKYQLLPFDVWKHKGVSLVKVMQTLADSGRFASPAMSHAIEQLECLIN